MTDILPPAGWPNVRQLETNEFATGGANGNMNEQAKSLAARSELLKQYAALPYESKTSGYALNERVQLATGDIVRSTIPSNVNNPNVDMTGWVKICDFAEVSPEMFGYKSGDATAFFLSAASMAKQKNLPFVARDPSGYLITESVDFYTETKISKIIMPNNGNYNTLRVKSMQVPDTVGIGTLTGLTEFSKKVTGLPDYAVGRYVHIETDQVLTERNNAPGNIPYYKLTAFKLLTSDGDISPSLDMTIASSGVATVKIFKPESRIDFTIGVFETVGSGLNHNSLMVDRDAVTVKVGDVIGQTGFRTFMGIAGNNTEVHFPVVKDAKYSGYGYGISVGLSCDTLINNMQGGNCRTALDGRHGANVTVTNSKIEVAGTHWGNNYLFKDCDIKTISWSGKDLTIERGSLIVGVMMRADVSLCTGVLDIDGTTLHTNSLAVMPSADQIAEYYTEPRRSFDVVKMRNIECTNDIKYLYGAVSFNTFAADHIPPKSFIFDNINAPNSNKLTLSYLFLNNALAFDEPYRYRVNNINAKLVVPFSARGFVKYPSTFGYDVRATDCGRVYVQTDTSAFSKYKVIDSTILAAARFAVSTANGELLFDDCVFDWDSTLLTLGIFNIDCKKGITSSEYQGAFTNAGSVNGELLYSIGCRAKKGATGYPPLDWYVNETDFIKYDVTVVYDPPSLSASGSVGAIASTTVPLVGARVGDFVQATFSIYNVGVRVSAVVSSTNTVTVLFENTTASPIDLASGNIRVKMV